MADSFVETCSLLVKSGFKADIVIQPGEGSPAVEGKKEITEQLRSFSLDANGMTIFTMSGRCLTKENAPNIAHYVA